MKSILKISSVALLFLVLIFLISCKEEKKSSGFTLIERNSYFMDSYNGIIVYRDNETKKPMDGYFIVGNKYTKWEEFNLANGILNGDDIVFHDNGEMYTHSTYLNGKLHGEEKKYYPSGKLQSVDTYNNGIQYGKSKDYYESGQLRTESKIENETVVESITYDIIGNIISQMFIDDGRKITQYIKNGKLFSEDISSTYDNFEAKKFYNKDGSLKIYLQMLDDQDDNHFLIELDENGDEIKRIDVKANPQEFLKYRQYFVDM